MSVTFKSVEQAFATAARDIVVGAKAVSGVLGKVATVVGKDAPVIEGLTAIVDPRAAAIERLGAALIGQAIPAVQKVVGEVATDAQAPTVQLTAELFNDLKSLVAAMPSELASAKAAVATSVKS